MGIFNSNKRITNTLTKNLSCVAPRFFISIVLPISLSLFLMTGLADKEVVNSMEDFQVYLLFTRNIECAIIEVESLGGKVNHRLSERMFIADIPIGLDPKTLTESVLDPLSDLNESEQFLLRSWQNSEMNSDQEGISNIEDLEWDSPGYEPPGHDSP